jgi:hypothetical protein
MSVTPDAIRKVSDELETNRQSRKSAWATLQRLRKFLEATGARISIPEDRSFETEGEAIESGLKRTIAGRDAVMRSLRELSTGSEMLPWLPRRKMILVARFRICIGSWNGQRIWSDLPDVKTHCRLEKRTIE